MGKLLAAVAALAVLAGITAIGLTFFTHTGEYQAPVSGATLSLDGEEFDLGDVPADQIVERSVVFRNTGTEALEVEVVKVRPAPDAACGCGVEGYEVRPASVPPGGSGEIVFKLRIPDGMADMEDVMTAQLQTNDSSNPNPKISLVFRMASGENVGVAE